MGVHCCVMDNKIDELPLRFVATEEDLQIKRSVT